MRITQHRWSKFVNQILLQAKRGRFGDHHSSFADIILLILHRPYARGSFS